MSRKDPRVDAYLAKSAAFARPVLTRLRALVHRAAPEAEETIKWGMPAFVAGGRILCGLAAFKAHCAFWFWRTNAAGVRSGMGRFAKITSLADLPPDRELLDAIRKVARAAAEKPARPAARRPAKPAAVPPVPPDLAAGLKKNRAAAAFFAKLSPSCRREYVEWIVEAKRDDTRARRLASTLEWLAEGKKRNWKYEGC